MESYIDDVVKKVNKRLYFLKQLKRAKVPCKSLVTFYTLCIRSVIDYAIPVFYHALPQYLQNDLKRLEKRAKAIIMPTESYSSALNILSIPSLKDHHEQLCAKLLQSVVSDTNHKIHDLSPDRNQPS